MHDAVHPKYDFRLPHLKLSPEPDSSTTDEPMIVGMFETVVFQIWDDFDAEIESCLKATSQLGDFARHMIRGRLTPAINRINELPSNEREEALHSSHRPQDVQWEHFAYYCCNNHFQKGDSNTFLSPDDDPRCISYGNSTSCLCINQAVFESVRVHLTAIFEKQSFNMVSRNYRLLGSFRTRSQNPENVRTRGPISDMSLVEIVGGTEQAPPICSFEMKGPRLDFSLPTRKFHRRQKAASCLTERDQVSAGDFSIIQECCNHEISAEEICAYFNYLFSSRKHYRVRGKTDVTLRIMMPIAQAVVQALTTSTGCGFLFTHETGIAFEVDSLDKKGRIVIRTSRLFCCNMQKGSLAAATALGEYAIRKHNKPKHSTSKVELVVKELLQFVDDFHLGKPSRLGGQGSSSHVAPTTNETQGTGTGGGCGSNNNAAMRSSIPVSGLDDGASEMNEEKITMLPDDSETTGSTVTQEHDREEAVLSRIGEQKEQFLAEGASGMIMSLELDGEKLVTKVWNGQSVDGLHSLRREVDVYNYIEFHVSSLLGSSVPSLFFAINKVNPAEKHGDLVLVTKYVGERLNRSVNGQLWIGDAGNMRLLNKEEETAICCAALSSLQAIHRAGIMHGDVELQNLRVQGSVGAKGPCPGDGASNTSTSTSTSTSTCTPGEYWRAWWIDLGEAQVGLQERSPLLLAELEKCRNLFECDF